MNFVFNAQARTEFVEAIAFYEEREEGLGLSLSREVYATINRIILSPLAGAPYEAETRRFFTRRFPFSIIYALEDETIIIFAVAHQKRKPDYWVERVKSIG